MMRAGRGLRLIGAVLLLTLICGGGLWLAGSLANSRLSLGSVPNLNRLLARFQADPFQADAVDDPPFASLTYAIQVFVWWDEGLAGRHLDWVRLLGFNTVKQTFAWTNLEPAPGVWDFSQADRIVREVERRDLYLVARLGQVPAWAATDVTIIPDDAHTDAPPDDLDAWATYCGTLAERYRGRIHAYQIWNEPNLRREWGNQAPDPQGYVDLLAACSAAIRAADPDAILISAGLAPTGNNDHIAMRDDLYLDALYRAHFQQHIDVVGVHAPGFSAPDYGPDDAEADGRGRWATFRRVEDLRKIMIQHGDAARQMAILEFGWTIDPVNPAYSWYAVTEAQQAAYIEQAFAYAVEHWRPWVGLMTLIYLPKTSWTPEDEEYWWAIAWPNYRPREAFFTLAGMRKVCDDVILPERPPDHPEFSGDVPPRTCP